MKESIKFLKKELVKKVKLLKSKDYGEMMFFAGYKTAIIDLELYYSQKNKTK